MTRSLERLIGIDREIRRGNYPNVDKLCGIFEVKPRTIYEDIRKLKDNFLLDIEYDRFHNGYVNRNLSRTLPSFDLSEAELAGLAVSSYMLSGQASFLKPDLDSALNKVETRVSESVKEMATEFSSQVHNVSLPLPSVSRRTFDLVRKAIRNQNRIEITYFAPSTNVKSRREIEPYRVLQHLGIWYLLAFCRLRKDLRMFALHRILEISVLTGAKFRRDQSLDIDAWISNAFQIERRGEEWTVSILFLPPAAPYIREKVWREGQQILEKPDGSCILTFKSLSLEEVKRWVMFYCSNAVVLRPRALIDMIEHDLKSALKNYRKYDSGQARRLRVAEQ